ncbi:MAG: hypothetical protein KatS3mg003_2113 [Candidatus Nitrosocaldaceae archaeon]|nr:MAG: hypothetical protein KatS3mg003_2046 [Candidatus Nitrosocaldaceae archaeon]GIU72634.1 MAG: hypothetical protein KatS3mg003_2113 [Candidatus Nitrosocaldaceae archaeon]
MLGESSWRDIINKAIDEKFEQIEKFDDPNKISIDECIGCLRRSYYNRIEPSRESKKVRLHKVLTNSMRTKRKEFAIDNITIVGYADAIIDGVLFNIMVSNELPKEPLPKDLLYLNANLCIFNIDNGVLIYTDGVGNTIEFSLSRDNRVFNELIRRIRILNTLLKEQKIPIIEPSEECIECQYQERCYMRKWKYGDSLIEKLLGKVRED